MAGDDKLKRDSVDQVEGALSTDAGGLSLEERLRATLKENADLRAALDEHAIVATTDARGLITFVNEKFCEISGYSRAELIGHDHRIINSGYHSSEFMRDLWTTIRSGRAWHGEIRNRAKNGSYYWVDTTIVPFFDDAGRIRQYTAIRADITERKRAEAALHEREEQLLLYAEHSPVAIAMLDREMRYVVVSRRWMEDFRLGSDSLVGRSHYAVFPEIPDEWKEIHRRCLAGAIERRDEDEFARADGTLHWLRWEVRPWRLGDGTVGGLIIFAEDITEKRNAVEEMESSRRLLTGVVEHSGSLVFAKDRDGRYLLVNKKWEEVTGKNRRQVLGLTDASVFDSDDAARFREIDLAVMEAGHAQTVEETLSDGMGARSFLSVKFPLRNANGQVTGICGMAAEITERKQAEEKLREQAALLDEAQDAIIVRDLEHRVTFWNKSAERLYGWTAEEVLGKVVRELLYDRPEVLEEAAKVVRKEGSWTGEIHQKTRDGRRIIVQGRWTLVHDEVGNPKAILSINTDLTERKKLEEQFLRAQRMESIGTLAGGIAHDLNNVLGPIMMSLQLLQVRFPDRQSQELISILSASAQRGADMVRQVLSFARGVSGERLEVQVRHLVRDIEKIVNETFLKHVAVRTVVPTDLWTVIGDATQIHQVLLNLCVNARDAMPNGGVLNIVAENLTLDEQYAAFSADAKAGPYVSIEVEDTGIGIPPEVIDRIFDPFFTTKEVGKGTGLGLSTTLAIVKAHGGFIRVYSEVGRGTKFKAYFPASAQSSQQDQASAKPDLPSGNGETILVVDDEKSVRQITQQTLQAFGYRVLVACDGAEALAIYAQQPEAIAAVITDMMMPIMDGSAIIQVLRRLNPEMPIIAASGLSTNENVVRANTYGAIRFLPKPYTAGTLLTAVKEVLAKGG